jgi:hypothetical protein
LEDGLYWPIFASLTVLSFSTVAGWFVRRPVLAVFAGTAIGAVLFVPSIALDPKRPPFYGFELAAGATLLAAAWGWSRLRRRPASPAFRLHWSGEGPLGRAVLRPLVLGVALVVLSLSLAWAPSRHTPRLFAASVLAGWSAAAPLVAWAIVGLWRTAGGHVARGGTRLLGWPVKLLAIAALFLAVVVAVEKAAPDFREYGRVALGPRLRDRYALRFLRGATELELTGELEWGVADDLEAALAQGTGVRVLHLDSVGGRIFEAKRIVETVRARRLTTYVAHRCLSACVRVFAAGEERLISRRADVGLHRSSGHNLTLSALQRSSDESTAYLLSRGVDRSLAARASSTPSDTLYRPSHDELFRSRLAARYAGFDEVGLSGYTADEVERLDLLLRETPLYQALFEFERPVFDRAVAALREGIRTGRTEAEALSFFDAEAVRILGRDLPRTSDRAARGFYSSFAATGRTLRARGGAACAAYLTGGARGSAAQRLPPEERDRFIQSIVDVMAGAALEPRPTPTKAAVRVTLVGVYERARERVPGLDVLQEPGAAAARPGEFCDATLAVADEIARLPDAEAGPLVRWLQAP